MKNLLLLIALVVIAGCSKSMTNDEIIAEIVKCRKAGLGVRQIIQKNDIAWNYGNVIRVECYICSSEVKNAH